MLAEFATQHLERDGWCWCDSAERFGDVHYETKITRKMDAGYLPQTTRPPLTQPPEKAPSPILEFITIV